jgi:hypothetical protein
MIIKMDRGTILANQPITPGWYKGKVKRVGPHEVSAARVDAKITLEFDDPALKADDRFVDNIFYNATGKGIGFVVSYMAAIKGIPAKEIADQLERGEAIDFDIDKTAGEPVMFKVINNQFEGRLQNRIDGFLPYNADIPV